jgi:hypothetical protein
LGIDRIGKGGASSPPEALLPKEGATPGASFEVRAKEAAPAAEVKASPALEGVRSGALDAKGYLDAKVHEATAHLTDLTPAQRAAVESVLRAQLASDPHLVELAQQATGQAMPKEDE